MLFPMVWAGLYLLWSSQLVTASPSLGQQRTGMVSTAVLYDAYHRTPWRQVC